MNKFTEQTKKDGCNEYKQLLLGMKDDIDFQLSNLVLKRYGIMVIIMILIIVYQKMKLENLKIILKKIFTILVILKNMKSVKI